MDSTDSDSWESDENSSEEEDEEEFAIDSEYSLSLTEELLELNNSENSEDGSDEEDDDYVEMSSESSEDEVQVVEEPLLPTIQEESDSSMSVSPCKIKVEKLEVNANCDINMQESVRSPDADGQTCTICFETWTNSGEHRLSSLNCGHVFGLSCIKRWLTRKDGRCPTCNAKAKNNDIRVIFANNLTAMDTAERDRALEELEKEKAARKKAEIEAEKSRLKCQLAEQELERLKELMEEKKRTQPRQEIEENKNVMFRFDRYVNVCDEGESRVMTYASYSNFLVVSKQLKTSSLLCHGISKLNGYQNWTPQMDIPCHSKQIRDLAFNPLRPDGMLLTASVDKSLCLSNVYNCNIAQRYQVEAPVWSCTWSRVNASQFYAGLQNGRILMFDTRNTKNHVQHFSPSNGANQPIISVIYIDPQPGLQFSTGGLLVGQMNQIYFVEMTPTGSKEHILPIRGNLAALTFDYKTRQILASFRPSTQINRVQHKLFELTTENRSAVPTVVDNVCSCVVNQTFDGGTKMSRLTRTALIPNASSKTGLLACVGDESKNQLMVWNIETFAPAAELQLPCVADVCLVGNGDKQQLACLNNRTVTFFNCIS